VTPRARSNADTGWRINRERATAEAVGKGRRNSSKDSWRGADAMTSAINLTPGQRADAVRFVQRHEAAARVMDVLLALGLRQPGTRLAKCHPTGTRVKNGSFRVISDGRP
jgi:hypothetical protein